MVESCYLLKYVEIRDCSTATINPWSIRQALIYQKSSTPDANSNHIFIRLSSDMKRLLMTALQTDTVVASSFATCWEEIHLLFLGSLTGGWRDYINYLDGEITKLVRPTVDWNMTEF